LDLGGKIDKESPVVEVNDGGGKSNKESTGSVGVMVACWDINIKKRDPGRRGWWSHFNDLVITEWGSEFVQFESTFKLVGTIV
jgi:hypothetical protein